MSTRNKSQSVSSPSNWVNWCRKTLFGNSPKETGNEESEPLRELDLSRAYSEDLETTGEVEVCPICTSSTKLKLCAAIPCKHEACERCWHSWQKEHKTCMLCAQPIKGVSYNAVTTSHTRGSNLVRIADDALEDALRAILRIKNELLEIVEKIDETHAHLSFLIENAQHGVFDGDSAIPIVQVEISTTHEQLEKLVETSSRLIEVDKAVAFLNKSMRELDACDFNALGEWSQTSVISFGEVLSPISKDKKTALYLQWKGVADLFHDLISSRLNILHIMVMVMPSEGFLLIGLLEKSKNNISSQTSRIHTQVQSFETEAAKFLKMVHNILPPLPEIKEQVEVKKLEKEEEKQLKKEEFEVTTTQEKVNEADDLL